MTQLDAIGEHRYPNVATPIQINGCTVPNRIARSAHLSGLTAGFVTDEYIAFHVARARGGVGLSFLEIGSVHPTCPSALMAFMPEVVPGYRKLADAMHAAGGRVFQQLFHGGAQMGGTPQNPAWSASAVPGPTFQGTPGKLPVPMTAGQIDEVVEGFGTAARHCMEGGLDGVEVHAAHSYLVGQFLSPLTNRRSDAYGGSAENRMRFLEEILASMRAATSPDFPIGMRLSGSEDIEGGLDTAANREIALAVESKGLVDFVDFTMGGYHSSSKMVGAMHLPHGYELEAVAPISRALQVPTMVTGRFVTVAHAEETIAAGMADIVSMARATLADPEIVNKSLAGREAEVRACIGSNQGCIGGLFSGRGLGCVVNPEVAKEAALSSLPPADPPRDVLVVGAGPAGMEAARVAAQRGHRVTVHEAADRPGGLVNWARLAPHRDELGGAIDWQINELHRLGVEIRLNSNVDAALIATEAPDAVVIATGSVARTDGFQATRPSLVPAGLDLAHVIDVVEFHASRPASVNALVVDDLGTYPAIGVAEQLLQAGSRVVLASSYAALGAHLGPSLQQEPAAQRLGSHDTFRFVGRASVTEVTAGSATLQDLDSRAIQQVEADLVVFVNGFLPRQDLYRELVEVHPDVRWAGDCAQVRDLQDAIADGYAVGREL